MKVTALTLAAAVATGTAEMFAMPAFSAEDLTHENVAAMHRRLGTTMGVVSAVDSDFKVCELSSTSSSCGIKADFPTNPGKYGQPQLAICNPTEFQLAIGCMQAGGMFGPTNKTACEANTKCTLSSQGQACYPKSLTPCGEFVDLFACLTMCLLSLPFRHRHAIDTPPADHECDLHHVRYIHMYVLI